MRRTLLIAFLFLTVNHIYAQRPSHTYTLSGTINTDTGKISLLSSIRGNRDAKVVNGKFMFTDSIDYPTAAWLFLYKNSDLVYRSTRFFIEPGLQSIICKVDSSDEIPEISNNTMKEYKNYNEKLNAADNARMKQFYNIDSIRKANHKIIPEDLVKPLARKTDSINNVYYATMLHYVKKHPDSYIVLWSLFGLLPDGYSPAYDSIYNHLSKTIKNTPVGKKLAEKLLAAKIIAVGSKFPQLELKNINDSAILLPEFNKNQGYTLIDFWYSHCGPCKQQFPAFKKMYDKYKPDGFEIIGISIDQADAIGDWKTVIKEKEIDWPQYRDKGKINAGKLSIEYYPTNFLLDRNGIIIKRNIRIEELEKLLAEQKKPD